MRRMAIIAGLLSLGLTAGFGQGYVTHGISPSVTSVTASNPAPGIAPSVTSVTRPNWTSSTTPSRSSDSRHHHHHNVAPYGGYYYPYYAYDPYYDQSQPEASYAQPQQVADQPEAPAQTVFENRPGYKPPPVPPDAAANQAPAGNEATASNQAAPEAPSEPEPTTVLVFRDGHQLEIGNYVIVGSTLYNMSGAYRSYKIQLADLDLPATIKANEDRGVDFHVPVVKKPA